MINKIVIAQKGDRLEQIAYKEYKTLKVINKVIEANSHLISKVILDDGDIVNLPPIKLVKVKEVKSLW